MKIKMDVKIKMPDLPSHIVVQKLSNNSNEPNTYAEPTIPIAEFSDDELREIAKEWGEELIIKAHEQHKI